MTNLLSRTEAADMLGLSLSSLHRLARTDFQFPKPIRFLGPRGKPQWVIEDIEEYILQRRRAA